MSATPSPQSVSPGCSPPNPWVAHSVVIDDITPEINDVATYYLRFKDQPLRESYRFSPGQFNMLYLPGYGESAISISGGPTAERPDTWAHTVRVAGNVTHALARLKPGDSLGLRGPFGSHWPIESLEGRDVIVVAGGIGLPPLRPAIEAISANRAKFGGLTLLYGSRTPDTLLFTRQFSEWKKSGWEIQLTVDRGSPDWHDHIGVVPLLLDRLKPLAAERSSLLVCGPDLMMYYVVQSALGRGLSRRQIWVSLERNMHCAIGLCGHCQFGPAFVCKDGPVFRFDRIESYLHVPGL